MAAISSNEGGGELWFSCNDINDCSLTEFHTGEESIQGTVNSATPITPESVLIELPMAPEQSEIALIPDIIDELQIDLRYQDDVIGISRPDLQVTIIIAQSTTIIEFEGDSNPTDGLSGPHFVEDAPLENGGDRLLWPEESIRILLQFEVERPGTWQLNLRGASYMFLDIIWSEDVEARNIDEPSSDGSPRATDLETNHYGALVEDDRDCWRFDVSDHEVLRITFVWDIVPSEIEQSHGQPDLILPDRRLAPSPDLETEVTNGESRMTWQWRALPAGEYDMCIGGRLNAFQSYQWAGIIAFEGIGPTSPEETPEPAVPLCSHGGRLCTAAISQHPLLLNGRCLCRHHIFLKTNNTHTRIRTWCWMSAAVLCAPVWCLYLSRGHRRGSHDLMYGKVACGMSRR